MARMDFGDCELDFTFNKDLVNQNYDEIKQSFSEMYISLCKENKQLVNLDFINFDDDKKSLDISVPIDWYNNSIFVFFLFQDDFKLIEKPGFGKHPPLLYNDINSECKKKIFRFTNEFLKNIDGGWYANWQVFTDGMYWSCGLEVNPNLDGEFSTSDYHEDSYDDFGYCSNCDCELGEDEADDRVCYDCSK